MTITVLELLCSFGLVMFCFWIMLRAVEKLVEVKLRDKFLEYDKKIDDLEGRYTRLLENFTFHHKEDRKDIIDMFRRLAKCEGDLKKLGCEKEKSEDKE